MHTFKVVHMIYKYSNPFSTCEDLYTKPKIILTKKEQDHEI